MPASRSNTCFDECSPTLRSFSGSACSAASSGAERHSQDGTVSSSTFFSRAGTPALRKYFCASTSAATCDQAVGHLDVVGAEHHRAVGIADLARGQPERDVRVGGLSCLGVAPLDPHPLPLCRWRGSPRGTPRLYKPPTRFPRRALASGRARTARSSLLCFNASSRGLWRPRILLRHVRGALVPGGNTKPLSGAGAANGAVTQTPFRRAPGGTSNHSRRTHSSYDGPFRSSRLSMAPVKKLLNVVGSCEIRGRLRCNAASIGYRNRIRKALVHSRVTLAVMESVSRDKSANAPLADGGSERLGCGRGGVTQPAARAGVPRSDSLRLILSEPATWQTLVSRASVARPGTQEFQKDSRGKFWPWDSRSRLALAQATDSISAQLGRSLGRDTRAARPGMSTVSTQR